MRWGTAGMVSSVVPFGYAQCGTEWLSVEHFSLALPQWDVPSLRVAVVADVHVNRPREADLAREAAKAAIAEKPDVILMPGDFANYSDPERLANLKAFLGEFTEAKCPVYATMGNHDYTAQNPRLLMEQFTGSPVRLLNNELVDLNGVTIAGLDDALFGHCRPDVIEPGRQAKSLLVMLHEPDYVDEVPSHVSLQLSGHSHGGQICLPFGHAVHTPYGAWKYVDGYYPDAKVPLFVTRGIGTTGPPYRLFCRPQVAVLTISPAA